MNHINCQFPTNQNIRISCFSEVIKNRFSPVHRAYSSKKTSENTCRATKLAHVVSLDSTVGIFTMDSGPVSAYGIKKLVL